MIRTRQKQRTKDMVDYLEWTIEADRQRLVALNILRSYSAVTPIMDQYLSSLQDLSKSQTIASEIALEKFKSREYVLE